jgi:hypothetical protein
MPQESVPNLKMKNKFKQARKSLSFKNFVSEPNN